jgi:hypothetical protein
MPTPTTWPWFGFMLSLEADAAPSPLSPAQIRSNTGQPLPSEHSKNGTSAWFAGGPLTNKNEHPDWSDTVTINAPINPALVTPMTFHSSAKYDPARLSTSRKKHERALRAANRCGPSFALSW